MFEDAGDVEKDLLELARRYIALVIRPEVLRLRRLVSGEAGHFPDLAETYYKRVPERVLGTLAFNLGRLAERGLLRLDDTMLAANHFVALILWVPLGRAMFHLEQEPFGARRQHQPAVAGLRAFLAAWAGDEGPRIAPSPLGHISASNSVMEIDLAIEIQSA